MTPEPWELDEESGDIRTPDGYLICSIAPHGSVNTISRTGETYSHDDARLVVKSPTILRLLKEVKESFKDYSNYDSKQSGILHEIVMILEGMKNL